MTQYQKNRQPNQKVEKRPKQTFLQRRHTDSQKITWKHPSLWEKCKSKLQWGITSHWSEWLSSKKSTNNKYWKECGEKGTLLHCLWEYKLIQTLWEIIWRSFKKLGIKLPYDSVIPLWGIYPDKTIIQKVK